MDEHRKFKVKYYLVASLIALGVLAAGLILGHENSVKIYVVVMTGLSSLGLFLYGRKLEKNSLANFDDIRTKAIVESAYDAFIGMDSKGFITDWNRQAELTLGWPREIAIGRTLSDTIIPERYREAHRKGLEKFLSTNVGPVLNKRIEISALHRNGYEIPVELTIYPIQYGKNLIFGSFLHDISERKNAEQKLSALYQDLENRVEERTKELGIINEKLHEEIANGQRLYEQAQTASRLKDEFLATVSHEVRTPLNVILGMSELLKDDSLPIEQVRSYISAIHRNATTQVQIINDLLDVSRIISGKMQLQVQPTDIRRVVKSAVENLQIAAEAKGLHIELDIDESNTMASADADRLQQVLWNLLSNAIKFTPKDGQIRVKCFHSASKISVSVADTGRGIDADFLPYVFERFRQEDASTTRRYGGLGLGLAIVRHIMDAHGGSIQVTSEGRDKGSCFTIQLPVLAVQSQINVNRAARKTEDLEKNSPTPRKSLEGLRVLLVDDEPDTRKMLTAVLRHAQADVVVADSAQAGLKLLQEFKPHVLLSDISMPDVDGYSFMHMVRSLPPEKGGQIPAAALTSHAQAEAKKRSLQAGFQVHISKPVDIAQLLNIVSDLGKDSKLSEIPK